MAKAKKSNKSTKVAKYTYDPPYHVTDGEWVFCDDGTLECCSCGLVHMVNYQLRDGKLYVQYNQDDEATRAARIARIEAGERP
jgi:hypothetical protein